ncbi:MAG: cyanophycinase [Limnohabitans sp.]
MSFFSHGLQRRQLMLGMASGLLAPGLMAQPARQARLVVIGGAEDRMQDRLILRQFVDYCGGTASRIRLITAASGVPDVVWNSYRQVFQDLGVADFQCLALTDRDSAHAPELQQDILQADGIFISGGDQRRLMQVLWETPAYRSLHEAFQVRGCCMAGTSAGAAVMSRHMIAQGAAVLRPSKEATETDMGLGFIAQAVVDQHFSERRRLARLLSTLALCPDLLGVGIDEDTALVIECNHAIEIIGRGAVTVVDPTRMQSNVDQVNAEEQMEMLGVELHMLPAGHRYSLDAKDAPRHWPAHLKKVLTRLAASGPIRG